MVTSCTALNCLSYEISVFFFLLGIIFEVNQKSYEGGDQW